MDENSLVNTDPELWVLQRAASRLEPLLKRENLIQGDTLIARDEMRHNWSVLVPRDRHTSQRTIFSEIHQFLERQELEAPLDAFTIVDFDDPGFQDLSRSAITPPARYRDFSVVAEIAGRLFSDAMRVPLDAADFEQYVMEAMTAVFPGKTEVEAMAPLHTSSAKFSRHLTALADFSLEYQGKLLMVETKAGRRPLSTRSVLAAYGALAITRERTGWDPFLMLVSMNGFTEDAYNLFEEAPNFALVKWTYGDDKQIFSEAFQRVSRINE